MKNIIQVGITLEQFAELQKTIDNFNAEQQDSTFHLCDMKNPSFEAFVSFSSYRGNSDIEFTGILDDLKMGNSITTTWDIDKDILNLFGSADIELNGVAYTIQVVPAYDFQSDDKLNSEFPFDEIFSSIAGDNPRTGKYWDRTWSTDQKVAWILSHEGKRAKIRTKGGLLCPATRNPISGSINATLHKVSFQDGHGYVKMKLTPDSFLQFHPDFRSTKNPSHSNRHVRNFDYVEILEDTTDSISTQNSTKKEQPTPAKGGLWSNGWRSCERQQWFKLNTGSAIKADFGSLQKKNTFHFRIEGIDLERESEPMVSLLPSSPNTYPFNLNRGIRTVFVYQFSNVSLLEEAPVKEETTTTQPVTPAQNDNSILEERVKQLEGDLDIAQISAADWERSSNSWMAQNLNLKGKLRRAEQEIEKLRSANRDLRDAMDNLTQELQEAHKTIDTREDEILDTHREVQEVFSKKKELQSQLDHLRKVNKLLTQENERLSLTTLSTLNIKTNE